MGSEQKEVMEEIRTTGLILEQHKGNGTGSTSFQAMN